MNTAKIAVSLIGAVCMAVAMGCAGHGSSSGEIVAEAKTPMDAVVLECVPTFSADSALRFMQAQMDFGPRMPNTDAHRQCAAYLQSELQRTGADVTVQQATLTAFDGTQLQAYNIMGSFNPEKAERILLMAHWDTRPWADEDSDPSNHTKPVPGANDGASGVGVLLEIARQIGMKNPGKGVDILFVDAEDWGSHEDEDSWALGADYFVKHPIKQGYKPAEVILLDMVGGKNARFHREYFSQRNAPQLVDKIWTSAQLAGFGDRFPNELGGAVTDDHVKFVDAGYKAVDIIEYNPGSSSGFNPTWHTVSDTMDAIDSETLRAVGQTLLTYLYAR